MANKDYKNGKLIEIIREFNHTGATRYEINGINQAIAVPFWRIAEEKFNVIPKGSYKFINESGNNYLEITDNTILEQATQFQICYVYSQISSKYIEEFPELSVMVNKYNELVDDATKLFSYLKSVGMTSDTLQLTKVLSQLEPLTTWFMDNDGEIKTLPISDLYGKFQQMIDKLQKILADYTESKKEEIRGATYIPYVSLDGIISFTNDKNKPNPEPVNIKGPAGTIENVTASVNSNAGTPSVKVTMSGTKENRSFNLEFQNLKGDPAIKGVDYYTPAEKEQFTTEMVGIVKSEGDKVVEQVKSIVAGNPATTNALTLSGKTRVEFENDIKHEAYIAKEDSNKMIIEGYSKEIYKDILSESNYTKGMYAEIPDGILKKVSNTAYNLHMFDIHNYETFKVKGVYSFDIYPIVFTDDNDKIIAHYPTNRNPKLDVITVECSKPIGATRLYVTEREVDKSIVLSRQITFSQNKELKEKLKYSESIKDLEIENYSKSNFKNILSDKYLIEGAYVESTDDDKKYKISKNASYKYYKVPVTPNRTIKTFGIYGFDIKAVMFLDSQDNFISSSNENRVTQISEKETIIEVPVNATYAIINGKTTTEIKCSEDGHLTFVARNKESKNMKLIKTGDEIKIESPIGKDTISIVSYLHGSQNQSFRFDKYYLNGMPWKVADDDITPLNFNSSYRGAGHGDDRGYTIDFSSPHNLTEINIGEIWTDKNNVEVLICKIINETSILICIPNNTAKSNESPFNVAVLASPLKKDTITKEFTTVKRGQFAPIQNFVDVKVICNNKQIIEDGEYTADYIDVVESYNLLYLPSMVEYLKNNVGRNTNDSMYSNDITDKYCTVNNVFRFTERGAITQYQSIDWYKTVKLNFVGMIQSQPIGSFISVPLTNKSSLQEMNTETVRFEQSSWNDINNPPNRYYQYTDLSMKKGICLGYNTEFGDGKPSIRKNINDAGFIYGSSKKLYPYLVSKVNGEDYISFISAISYRVPMTTYSDKVPSVGWYYVNNDIYLLVNIQKPTNAYINLPEKMIGRKVSLIEKEGDINIYDEFVGAKGIKIVVTGYAAAIIKLTL